MHTHQPLLSVLLLCAATQASAQNRPSLACVGTKPVVTLPASQRAVLAAHYPGFHEFNFNDYHPYVRRPCNPANPEAPFALVADLDEDGTLDIALDGQDPDSARVITLLSNRGHPAIISSWSRASLVPALTRYDDSVGLWWEVRRVRGASVLNLGQGPEIGRYLFSIMRVEHGSVMVYWDGLGAHERDLSPGD